MLYAAYLAQKSAIREQTITRSNLNMTKKGYSRNIMYEKGTSLGTIEILFLLTLFLRTCTALQVFAPRSPVTGYSGSSVLLECFFNDTAEAVDLSKLVLTWRFQNKEVAKYDEDADETVTKIPRAELFVDELQSGNASLLLKYVTSGDAGKYTCSVQYTLYEIQNRKLTLNVLDPPVTTKPTFIPTEVIEVEHVSTALPAATTETIPTEATKVTEVSTELPATTKETIPTEATETTEVSTDLPEITGTTEMPIEDKNMPHGGNSGSNLVAGALIFPSVLVALYLL
ncbi:programmed cell death 1 ligand 1-like isoform X2 [Protopterus annectens]|uniref:programmed cell death 1 ligand 1-like isoform X2 n=1 Tax=Protopterus annectens TaxID=7888 RepID=UPI001CFA1E25|nr:programmed cell death 1 ligand 1-like isoform X2 [Protopterus annectens]